MMKTEVLLIRFVSLALVVFVSACQSAYKGGQPNEGSPYYRVPVDSKLILHRHVTIPAKQASVYFQGGRSVTRFYEVKQYKPYCRFTLNAKKAVPQTIQPDEFVIRKVSQRNEFTVDGGFIQVAAISGGDGFQIYEVVATVMELSSESQPDVVRLTCASWGLPQDISYVTIRKIRQTFGNIFTLQLAESR